LISEVKFASSAYHDFKKSSLFTRADQRSGGFGDITKLLEFVTFAGRRGMDAEEGQEVDDTD
jgi:hypothetical protein